MGSPKAIQDRLERKLRGERRRTDRPGSGGRRRTDHEPNHGWRPACAIALGVALADWATKWLVSRSLPLESIHILWPGRVALWHVRNPAMVLGLYGGFPLAVRVVIAAISAVLAVAVLIEVIARGHRLAPNRRVWAWLFVGLAAGGMLGNLGERAVHWGVTDYLSFAWGDLWLPPGNVADLAIMLSLPIAVVVVYFELRGRAQRRPVRSPLPAATATTSPAEHA